MPNECWGPDAVPKLHTGEIEHEDGRVCWLMDGRWWIRFHERSGDKRAIVTNKIECVREHHTIVPADNRDRSEFGMAALGACAKNMVAGMNIIADRMMITEALDNDKPSRVCNIMDEAQTLYRRKARGYEHAGGDTADVLGAKGQFADINRKFWVLKGMLWDETITPYPDAGEGEDVEQVLMDFIGHAALTIDFLRQSQGRGEEGTT
jgi:hypothetical protein